MSPLPRQLANKFIPNLGDLYEIGLANVGVSVVRVTIPPSCASEQSDAQLIAAPPNTGLVNASSVVVHSLGIAPTAVFLVPLSGTGGVFSPSLVTANASAAFWRVSGWTLPPGQNVQQIAIR
jgi:hypothetical protein